MKFLVGGTSPTTRPADVGKANDHDRADGARVITAQSENDDRGLRELVEAQV